MACIIKIPTAGTKGVISFTTQERDRFILKSPALQKKIEALKKHWLVGLHHNWHDWKFKYNPLFDFSMAGEDDLREVDGKDIPLLPMDACNFVQPFFRDKKGNEKFWDILYVARAVRFKKIPEFFDYVRRAYDAGKKYRILFVCPIPPYDRKDRRTAFYDIRTVYDRMFTKEEQKLFTLLSFDYGYPFPLDIETLSFFYRSSKIFVHFADDERRCRVAAYAWATGLPVVGMACIGSLLPVELRRAPYFYEVNGYGEFDGKIDLAIDDSVAMPSVNEAAEYFELGASEERIDRRLEKLFREKGLPYSSEGFLRGELDLRMGRHIIADMESPNTINISFESFIDTLIAHFDDLDKIVRGATDPEKAVAALSVRPRQSLRQRLKTFLNLKK